MFDRSPTPKAYGGQSLVPAIQDVPQCDSRVTRLTLTPTQL